MSMQRETSCYDTNMGQIWHKEYNGEEFYFDGISAHIMHTIKPINNIEGQIASGHANLYFKIH